MRSGRRPRSHCAAIDSQSEGGVGTLGEGRDRAISSAFSSVPLGRAESAQIDAMDVGVEVPGGAAGAGQWRGAVSRLHKQTWAVAGVNGQRGQGLA